MWFTFSAPSLRLPTTISFGSWRYVRAIFSISLLIVAEKSSVLRSSGTPARMVFMSSAKPMFSISSASSSTTLHTAPSFATPRFIRSMSRPGVATMM